MWYLCYFGTPLCTTRQVSNLDTGQSCPLAAQTVRTAQVEPWRPPSCLSRAILCLTKPVENSCGTSEHFWLGRGGGGGGLVVGETRQPGWLTMQLFTRRRWRSPNQIKVLQIGSNWFQNGFSWPELAFLPILLSLKLAKMCWSSSWADCQS